MRRPLVLALAGAAAGVLIAGEFAPLFTVSAGARTIRTVHAGAHHGYALGLLALLGLGLAWAGTREALLGLAAVGLAALLVVGLIDRPDTTSSGLVPGLESAHAHARAGLWLGLAGAVGLLVAAGAGLLARRRYQR